MVLLISLNNSLLLFILDVFLSICLGVLRLYLSPFITLFLTNLLFLLSVFFYSFYNFRFPLLSNDNIETFALNFNVFISSKQLSGALSWLGIKVCDLKSTHDTIKPDNLLISIQLMKTSASSEVNIYLVLVLIV